MSELKIRITGGARTDVGRVRKNNEDAFLYEPELGLFAVADGMGGHAGGEVASAMAVEILAREAGAIPDERYRKDRSVEGRQEILDWLRRTILTINEEIYARAAEETGLTGMGCTLEVLLLCEHGVFLGHVGDSRSYLLREGQLHRLTQDHILATDAVAAGLLTEEQAKKHPMADKLTRALGPTLDVKPDTLYFELGAHDTYLLCTDGVHGSVGWEVFHRRMQAGVEEATVGLIQEALEAGSRDNCTSLFVEVEAAEHEAALLSFEEVRMALSSCSLFATFTPHELLAVQKIVTVEKVAQGEYFQRPGERTEHLIIVAEGAHSVWIEGQKLGEGGAGDPIGDLSLQGYISFVTYRAETDMVLLMLPIEGLHRLMATDTPLMAKLSMAALARVGVRAASLARTLARYREVYGPTP